MMNRLDDELLEYLDYLYSPAQGYRGTAFTGKAYTLCSRGFVRAEDDYLDGVQYGISRLWDEDGMLLRESSGGSIGRESWRWHVSGGLEEWSIRYHHRVLYRKNWDETGSLTLEESPEKGNVDLVEFAGKVPPPHVVSALLPKPIRLRPSNDQREFPTRRPNLNAILKDGERFDFTAGFDVSNATCGGDLQLALSDHVVREDRLSSTVRTVAGVDVAYEKDGDAYEKEGNRFFAAVTVHDANTLELIETQTAVGYAECPYIPGRLAFRELPCIDEAFRKLSMKPDLVICDGQGIMHPMRCGLASHFGLIYDVPTIGCGKTHLLGTYEEPGEERGAFAEIIHQQDELDLWSARLTEGRGRQPEVVGYALRTQGGVKPLFVSIGHRISLPTAAEWILRLTPNYRQPEPIRSANEHANALRNRWVG